MVLGDLVETEHSKFFVKRSSNDENEVEKNPLMKFVHETFYVNGELGFDEWTNKDVLNENNFYYYHLGNLLRARDSALPERKNAAQISFAPKQSSTQNGPVSKNTPSVTQQNIVSSSLNVMQQDQLIKGPSKSTSQTYTPDDYKLMFDYRALKRKEGEEMIVHKESVQKFKSHAPPSTGPNAKIYNSLPERSGTSVWTGSNG